VSTEPPKSPPFPILTLCPCLLGLRAAFALPGHAFSATKSTHTGPRPPVTTAAGRHGRGSAPLHEPRPGVCSRALASMRTHPWTHTHVALLPLPREHVQATTYAWPPMVTVVSRPQDRQKPCGLHAAIARIRSRALAQPPRTARVPPGTMRSLAQCATARTLHTDTTLGFSGDPAEHSYGHRLAAAHFTQPARHLEPRRRRRPSRQRPCVHALL
jgi:hypothetical protein